MHYQALLAHNNLLPLAQLIILPLTVLFFCGCVFDNIVFDCIFSQSRFLKIKGVCFAP